MHYICTSRPNNNSVNGMIRADPKLPLEKLNKYTIVIIIIASSVTVPVLILCVSACLSVKMLIKIFLIPVLLITTHVGGRYIRKPKKPRDLCPTNKSIRSVLVGERPGG